MPKRHYMREHSHVVRQWTSSKGVDKIEENQVLNVEGDARTIIVTICRIRQRILTQAWSRWVHNSGVHHDYEKDIKLILSRKLPDDGLRTELEVEVLFKWVEQVKDVDPTGIANTIYQCKSKAAVYNALQQLRLEFYEPGETILFQGDLPRPEDGHFTILNGSCEVVQFPEDSLPLLKLQTLARKRRWDEAKQLLLNGQILAKIKKSSGFGELATLTNTKRAASTRTARKESLITEILVLPKEPLLDCLKAKRDSGVEGAATSEAIDYMRQSGLANRISSNDLVLAANSMLRRTLLQGEILYCKGEPVSSLFLVVSGEFLLDTGEVYHDGKLEPFIRSQADKCYHLSSGSMLGDEGVTGQSNTFESTAVVVSEAAVVFEAVGYGVHFLAERIGALRYCALAYKLKSRWSTPVPLAEQINPYTYFNSLRKAIALSQPFRGTETSSLSSNIDINMKNNKPPPKSADGRSSRERSGSRNWVKRLSVSVEGRRGSKSRGETPEHRITAVAAFLVDRVDTRGFSLRKLNTVGLHHAIEINKIAKKRHHQTVKQHAKENILLDQLMHAPPEDIEHIERTFKKSLKDFKRRELQKAKELLEEEMREKEVQGAVKMSMNFLSAVTGATQDEDDNFNLSENNLQRQNSSMSSFSTPQKSKLTRQQSILSDQISEQSRFSDSNEFNMHEEYENYHTLTKMEQYFTWIDHLSKQHYKILLKQAYQSSELAQHSAHQDFLHYNIEEALNFEHVIGNKKSPGSSSLSNVLSQYGLLPSDLSIPWFCVSPNESKNNSPKAGIGGKVGAFTFTSTTSSASVPKLELSRSESFSRLDNRPDTSAFSTTGEFADITGDGDKTIRTKSRKESGKTVKKRVFVEKDVAHFKTYNPSSWRNDQIRQKAMGLNQKMQRFARFNTPHNRRVMDTMHIIPPSHENPMGTSLNYQSKTARTQITKATGGDMEHLLSHYHDQGYIQQQQQEYEQHLYEIDDPELFMKTIKDKDFSERKHTLCKYDWNTRFMKLNSSKTTMELPSISPSSRPSEKAIEDDSNGNEAEGDNQNMNDNMQNGSRSCDDVEHNLKNQLSFDSTSTFSCNIGDSFSEFGEEQDRKGARFNLQLNTVRRISTQSEIESRIAAQAGIAALRLDESIPEEMMTNETLNDSNEIVHCDGDLAPVTIKNLSDVSIGELEAIAGSSSTISMMENLPPIDAKDINQNKSFRQGSISLVRRGMTAEFVAKTETNDSNMSNPLSARTALSSVSLTKTKNGKNFVADKDPSDALRTYKKYILSEPPPRKFFDGRKKGNESSKFKLLQTLNNDLESIYRPDSTLLNVSDKALINSIYPPNYKDQLGLIKKRDQAANLLSSRKKKLDYKPVYIHEIDDEDGDNFSEKNLDQNIPRETNKLVNTNLFRLNELSTDKSGILTDETKSKRNMMDESHTSAESHNESANEEDNEEYEADPELEAWQAFTVDLMTKTKKGPQKTLPVIGASRTDVSSKSLKRVKKATGALFELPGEADFELIRGPSSYLEVYKKHFKIRSSAKDRLAVANQLQNRKTDKKFF